MLIKPKNLVKFIQEIGKHNVIGILIPHRAKSRNLFVKKYLVAPSIGGNCHPNSVLI